MKSYDFAHLYCSRLWKCIGKCTKASSYKPKPCFKPDSGWTGTTIVKIIGVEIFLRFVLLYLMVKGSSFADTNAQWVK